MAKEETKNYVRSKIYTNGNHEVSAQNTVEALDKMIDDSDNVEQQVATLGAKVGDLSKLVTTDKKDLVGAINEAYAHSGGGGGGEDPRVSQLVQDVEDIEERVGDRVATSSNMGYVVLDKDKAFAEQVTKANTIYEIRYAFDLEGGEVAIPEGCTLKFEGGSLINGTVLNAHPHITLDAFVKCAVEYGSYITTNVNVGDVVDLTSKTPASKWCNTVIKCQAGDIIVISGVGGYTSRLWCFIDENHKLISKGVSNLRINNLWILCPSDSAYIVFNSEFDSADYKPEICIARKDSRIVHSDAELSDYDEGRKEYVKFPISGRTIHRPTLNKLNAGVTFYDTDLSKLLSWNGESWDPLVPESESDLCLYKSTKLIDQVNIKLCESLSSAFFTFADGLPNVVVRGSGYTITGGSLSGYAIPKHISNVKFEATSILIRNDETGDDITSISTYENCTFINVSFSVKANTVFNNCTFINCITHIEANFGNTREAYEKAKANVEFRNCSFTYGDKNRDNNEIIHCVWVGYKGQLVIDSCEFNGVFESSDTNVMTDMIDCYSTCNLTVSNCIFYLSKVTPNNGLLCIKAHSWTNNSGEPWTAWTANDLLGEKSNVSVVNNKFQIRLGESEDRYSNLGCLIFAGGFTRIRDEGYDWREESPEGVYFPRTNIAVSGNQVTLDSSKIPEYRFTFCSIKDVKNVDICNNEVYVENSSTTSSVVFSRISPSDVLPTEIQYPANVLIHDNQVGMNIPISFTGTLNVGYEGYVHSHDNIVYNTISSVGEGWVHLDSAGNRIYPQVQSYPVIGLNKTFKIIKDEVASFSYSTPYILKIDVIDGYYKIFFDIWTTTQQHYSSLITSTGPSEMFRKKYHVLSTNITSRAFAYKLSKDRLRLYIVTSLAGALIVNINTGFGTQVTVVSEIDEEVDDVGEMAGIISARSITEAPDTGNVISLSRKLGKLERLVIGSSGTLINALGYNIEYKSEGTTSERPSSLPSSYVGFRYFDTTINRPIWWNGSKWVDATGTDV